MKSTIWGMLMLCLYAFHSTAQIKDLQQLLINVEEKNHDLKAYREQIKAQELVWRSTNNPSDPQLSGYYLPFGQHNTPDYWEFELTQTVEFPSVYTARSRWIDRKIEKQQLEYEARKKEKLLQASRYYYEIVYLGKMKEFYQHQVENASRVLKHSEYLFEKGETGRLELNKAQIVFLEPQFELEDIQTELNNRTLSLEVLCSCENLLIDSFNYEVSLAMDPLDSIINEAVQRNKKLEMADIERKVATVGIDVAKNQQWPSLSAGFNYQGVLQNNYAGFFAGLSLPLWSQKHKVEANEAQLSVSEAQYASLKEKVRVELRQDYEAFTAMHRKYVAYRGAFDQIQSEILLRKAFELGELSFLEYYQEIQFYIHAKENLLKIEKELYHLKAKILQYEL